MLHCTHVEGCQLLILPQDLLLKNIIKLSYQLKE